MANGSLRLAEQAVTISSQRLGLHGPLHYPQGMEELRFERQGTTLFCRRWPGPAERTLVMFHGLASNGTRWREFAESAQARCDWQILCPDLRGHGHSSCRGRLTSREWMEDCIRLLDRIGCERAVVGGHCLGANLAMRLALNHPDRVRALVLVEPMLPAALRGGLRYLRPIRWALPALAWPIRALNALGVHRRELPVLDLTELDRQSRAVNAAHGDSRAMLARYARPNKDMAYMPVAMYLQALYQVLREVGPIERIRAPGLALLSAGALLADPVISRRLLQVMPKLRIEQVEALHWIPTERPGAMTRLIVEFLDSLSLA
ncbi:MAG: alpha/beta hydrolase [Wenzhouxiangella sp.]|nr:MAG: alpha/beta hydrolase [Wenzhouxiangella sp.]